MARKNQSADKTYIARRKVGTKSYRPVFLISTEGTVTEPEYFNRIKSIYDNVSIQLCPCRGGQKGDPLSVLKRLKFELKKKILRKNDQAWVVIDRDQWEETHIQELLNWENSGPQRGVALSNPKFEYWVLLHYENVSAVATSSDCDKRLAKYR